MPAHRACLSLLSRPPFCDSCRPTYVQCSLFNDNDNIITEPFIADDVEIAINDLSPRSTQSVEPTTMSPMVNALTNATVALVEDDTETPAQRRIESQGAGQPDLIWQLLLKDLFQPITLTLGAWRDRDL